MISIYKIKPKFQKLLLPILHFFNKLGITANQITFSAIFLSVVIGVLFWFADYNSYFYLTLPIGLLLRMALNALDGMMARIYKQQSKKGELLNEFGDIISDLIIFLPLIKYESQDILLVVLFISLSIINEFAGLLGKVISNERRYEGPMGKSDRAFVIAIYGILGFIQVNLHNYITYIFIGLILLLLLSTITRLTKSLK
ncbi:MAG: CDP-alcohol phosphatidyltransferase family protein [Vicingaceae bacterium]|nr:CDP-alcohol phosphatidyltransferase family protein [Vicingaceae bacterium]